MTAAVRDSELAVGRARLAAAVATLTGLAGAVLCTAAMGLAFAGALGAATTGVAAISSDSMSGMASHTTGSQRPAGLGGATLQFLVQMGPAILVISVIAFAGAIAYRHRPAGAIALLGGIVMYLGMYSQGSISMMYGAVIVGFVLWAVAYARSRVVPSNLRSTSRAD